MSVKRLFATKSLEMLHAEMAEDEGRLRRVLGPIGLTSLGIGAIIGAGIFVMTGRVAGQDSGPAIMTSFVVAGIGCALAAFCYAEFASMVPVAGSAYTYAYATLGELIAWAIGWDLILEYAMSCATVASAWTKYFNEFLTACHIPVVPDKWSHVHQVDATAVMNLPAVLVVLFITVILVIGIRESAAFNTLMVAIKLSVVLLVIVAGYQYVHTEYWTQIPQEARRQPQEFVIPDAAKKYVQDVEKPAEQQEGERIEQVKKFALAEYKLSRMPIVRTAYENGGVANPDVLHNLTKVEEQYKKDAPQSAADKTATAAVLKEADKGVDGYLKGKWGLLGLLGVHKALEPIDHKSNYFPYGLSGMMVGAALVFFAFIGFDSISTHSEEAIKPQRDVPFGILASLFLCTILYIAVAGVITGMVPYPEIDDKAAVASAFRQLGEQKDSGFLRVIAGLIAAGGLAGLTSVILITFLSQARIFLAMARDGMLPKSIFAAVHPKFKTPHISTILVGLVIAGLGGFVDTDFLEEMVNIGTLFAFVVVCGSVLLLRIRRPDAQRPFRCPLLFVVAPLGILINVLMMTFLPVHSWERLVLWMAAGLVLYFCFGYWNSSLGKRLSAQEA
jgi:amino acid transporter